MSNFFTKLCDYPMSLYHEFDPSRFIIITVAFSQGIQHLSDLSIQYMFKDDFKVSPAKMGLLMSYVAFPWIIKPVWGLFTDSKPFLGYRRKSYLVLFGMTGSMGWVLLAYYGINNMYYALAILFMIQFSVCFANVVGEAILVELAGKKNDQISAENQDQEFQNQASKNVSLFFGVRALGALISAYFSGALLIYITKKEVFLITSIFPLVLAIVALFLKEEKISGDNIDDRRVNTTQCLKDFWKFFKNPLIYKPVTLIFCFMMAPSSSAIMFYFYTSVLNFTPQFLGQLKFLYAFGTIAGVLLYNTYLKGVSFKVIFCTTTIIYYFCYQSLIILVTRKNVEWGINDKIFCIGDSVMLQLVGELNLMPILVLACRMCPKNIEGTMYAMLMSTLNMGSMIGTQWGSLFLIMMGINENDYSKLWLFIMVTGVFILFPLPFVYVVKEDEILKQRELQQQNDPSEIVVNQLIQEERKSSYRMSDKETFAAESNEEQQKLLNE